MAITPAEIAETRGMVEEQNLDIRTITMGVSLMGCGDENLDRMCTKIYDHVTHTAEHLVETAENLEREYGIPIVNKRVSVTPVAQIAACCKDEDLTPIAHALDRAAETLGIDYLGGFSALVQKGIGDADRRVIQSIPKRLPPPAASAPVSTSPACAPASTWMPCSWPPRPSSTPPSSRPTRIPSALPSLSALPTWSRTPRLWRAPSTAVADRRRHQRRRLGPRRYGRSPGDAARFRIDDGGRRED